MQEQAFKREEAQKKRMDQINKNFFGEEMKKMNLRRKSSQAKAVFYTSKE